MRQRILFRLTQDYLLVANTGKPFNKEGFESVCYSDTSSKQVETDTPGNFESEAKRWVAGLIEKKQKTFSDPNQLRSASGTEQRTAKDYSARLLLELLQNAIDADRQEQIGYKGIGFRSVLNEGEVIEIHSGHLHVRWSDADARKALEGLGELPERLPILDLPVWSSPDTEVAALLKVAGTGSYDTVVKLKINNAGREHVFKEWHKLVSDPSLLLFVDGNIEICWESEHSSCTWTRSQNGEFVTVSVAEAEHPSKELRWRSFASGHARAAYVVNENGRFQPSNVSEPRLRSYLPANQSPHPFPNLFLHHGKFELQSNRESVNPNETHLGELAQAMLLAARSAESQAELLDLILVGNLDDNDESRIDSKVWKAAWRVFTNDPLPALGGFKFADIKTCPKAEHLPYNWSGELRLQNWAGFLSALSETRPMGLMGLPVLEPSVENPQREATLLKLNPTCAFTAAQLQQQTWAPVEASREPVSSNSFKVFLPHKGVPLSPPQGIQVRFLSEAFRKACGTGLESFLTDTLGVLKFSAGSVIEHSVLPALTDQPVKTDGDLIQFLKRLRESDQKESKEPVDSFNWRDSVRRELIQQLHVECQGRSWPILKVYAGKQWTGNSFLESAYGEERGYLDIAPLSDEDQRNSWSDFWKWLGVGWCPKVLPLCKDVDCRRGDQKGFRWNSDQFSGEFFGDFKKPVDWGAYGQMISSRESFPELNRKPRLKANWTIDGGVEKLTLHGAFAIVATNWKTYEKSLASEVCYSGNKQKDFDDTSMDVPSHLGWLFQTAKWIPCNDNMRSGRDVFQPSGPVAKELKSFVSHLALPKFKPESTLTSVPAEFLDACGVRNGWNEVNDGDWESWLKIASQLQPEADKTEQIRDSIRGLYRALIDHRKRRTGSKWNEQDAKPLHGVALWCIKRSSSEFWHLLKSNDPRPFFVDRADVANVNLPGLQTFPVRLDGLAERAKQHLGLPLLSGSLSGEPIDQGIERPKFAAIADDRLHELVAYLRLDNEARDDAKLQSALKSVTLRETSGLTIQFSLYGKSIGEPLPRSKFQQFNKEDHTWRVFVDSDCPDDERWEAFAEALLLACELPADKASNVEKLLCCEPDRLPERLTKLGVAPETAERLKQIREERPEPPLVPPPSQLAAEDPGSTTTNATIDPTTPSQRFPPEDAPPFTTGSHSGGHSSNPRPERRPRLPTDGQHSPSSRPHPEEGMSAQRWLFERVKPWCADKLLPPPVWEQDYVDITIPLHQPLFIEAKRIDGSTIHWSRNQIEKAKGTSCRYVVALLRPKEGDEEYEVFWVTRPLDAFLILTRQVEWTWQVHKEGAFQDKSWDEPHKKPCKPANSFNAEITIPENWLQALPMGIDTLTSIIGDSQSSCVINAPGQPLDP